MLKNMKKISALCLTGIILSGTCYSSNAFAAENQVEKNQNKDYSEGDKTGQEHIEWKAYLYMSERGKIANEYNKKITEYMQKVETEKLDVKITSGDYEYVEFDGGVIITSYIGNDENVVIPSELDGKKVIGIASFAFDYRDTYEKVKSIKIEEGIEYICENSIIAPSVTEIVFPDSVKFFGGIDYGNMKNLKKITLGKNVDYFGYCTSLEGLEEINVSKDNKSYVSEDGILFSKDKTNLVKYPANKKGSDYTVPEGTKYIGDFAFSCNRNLKSINFNSDLDQTGQCAFTESKLENVNFAKDGKVQMMTQGFSHCKNLKTIDLRGVQVLSDSVFYDTVLEKVIINESMKKIEDFAFSFTNSKTEFEIHNNIDIIGDGRLGRQDAPNMKLYKSDDVIFDNVKEDKDKNKEVQEDNKNLTEEDKNEKKTEIQDSDKVENDSNDTETLNIKSNETLDGVKKESQNNNYNSSEKVSANIKEDKVESAASENTADFKSAVSLALLGTMSAGSLVFFKRKRL